jgi:hypothetical protein
VCENWVLQREPALQVISYLGDAVPVLPNGMANQLAVPVTEVDLGADGEHSEQGRVRSPCVVRSDQFFEE